MKSQYKYKEKYSVTNSSTRLKLILKLTFSVKGPVCIHSKTRASPINKTLDFNKTENRMKLS